MTKFRDMSRAEREETEKQKAANFNNAMQMQSSFFALRERFFVLLTDKFPSEYATELLERAHQAAKLDFLRRSDEAKAFMKTLDIHMETPALFAFLANEK